MSFEGNNMRDVEYTCADCGAKDTLKQFPGEPDPVVFNCWKCGSGRNMEVSQMLQRSKGMYKVEVAPAN